MDVTSTTSATANTTPTPAATTAAKSSDYSTFLVMLTAQIKAVLFTIAFSGIGSFILFKLVDLTMGLRVKEEVEREGLDVAEHGERAYNM